MCMHIPRARHQFPPLCPVLLSVLGIGWWVTLAPCVHHHIWGGGQTLGLNTSKWVMPLGAHTLQVLRQRIHYNDGQCDRDIRDTVSRDCHAGVSCHYIVTLSSPGQRSRHYPDKIISDIWIWWMMHQMKVQCGKLFFRIDSMCNSVKCDTPCFMEWCHATNLSNPPVCSMSETLVGSANFIYINVSSFNRSKHLCQFNRFIVFGLGIYSHFEHVGYAMIHMFENIFTRQFCKVSDISL